MYTRQQAIQIRLTTYYFRGIAKAGLGKYDEAIADYDKAIKSNSMYEKAYQRRGVNYE